MASEFRSVDCETYKMVYAEPHKVIEPPADEVALVGDVLDALRDAGIIPHTDYDDDKFLAFRAAVAERFEIPWTAITPRMQRLIWAINAITQPKRMIAAGCFCGNTFISNAGAAVGPGAVYEADDLVGIEIKPEEAERAERNVRTIDPSGTAHIVASDAIPFCAEYPHEINLLYLDADGAGNKGKGVYLDILQAAWDKMPAGTPILAHNSVNCADKLSEYLAFVRSADHCRASVNVVFDIEGLEVSVK